MTQAGPEIEASEWMNSDDPLSLASLRGKVVAVEAFQMLCQGCVKHGLPQAQRIRHAFRPDDVAVIGLHCVFEHHEAMTPVALRAFLYEFGIRFPVAVDSPGPGFMPRTMARWSLEGTPTLLLFDRRGRIRHQHFGKVSDMAVGAEIMALMLESETEPS